VIHRIGLDQVIVQGVQTSQLALGPGHYRGTALSGQWGNAAIAGHRTTHGTPFNGLADLEPGDAIVMTTLQGRFI
jgi:sortase A